MHKTIATVPPYNVPFAVAAWMLVCTCSSGAFGREPMGDESHNDELSAVSVEESTRGLLIANGEYIPLPYRIKVTESGVTEINGTVYDLSFALPNARVDQPKEPFAGRFPKRPRHGMPSVGRGRPFQPGGSAFRSHQERPNGNNQPDSFGRGDDVNAILPEDIPGMLRGGSLVVISEKDQSVRLFLQSEIAVLADALENEAKSSELPTTIAALLPGLRHNADLQLHANRIREVVHAVEDSNYAEMQSVRWLDTMAYPLSTVGMMLVVFSTGLLLSNRPPQGKELDEQSDEAATHTTRFVMLIVAFSILDLLWTIFASHDGSMKELNPIASRLVQNPALLIAFKALTTGVAVTILFRLRQAQRIHLASWWVCLLLTLLTARWLMFNSMLV